jgi:hypothetical protein
VALCRLFLPRSRQPPAVPSHEDQDSITPHGRKEQHVEEGELPLVQEMQIPFLIPAGVGAD